jgi:hypothetical protein
MKCFARLVMTHINTIITDTLDPLQFTYHPNRSTDDATSITLHTAFSHLDQRGNNCVRMLFIDYSSVFNTTVPSKLITLGLNPSLCRTSQEYVLSPLLYSLFTQDCAVMHNSNTIIKFAESAYREEVRGSVMPGQHSLPQRQ